METRVRLGSTELSVSPVCFGCWQMGQDSFWGTVDEQQLHAAVHAAIDHGINFFDNANAYGNGKAEEVLAAALDGVPRDSLIIATKVYWHFEASEDGKVERYPDLRHDAIMHECEQSLKRLKTDYIDLYQIHSWQNYVHPHEVAAAIDELKESGKIRHAGVSNFNPEQLRAYRKYADFATVQPHFSLLAPEAETQLFPYCMAEDIGVLTYGSLAKGLLSGKFKGDEQFDDVRQHSAMFNGERFAELAGNVRKLADTADAYGLSITQLSVAATLMHPGVDSTIIGIKSPEQAIELAGAMGHEIKIQDYFRMRALLNQTR